MRLSGFTYVRNGFEYSVPFLESIQSILPICDEFIVVVGDSHDGTREAIEDLNSDKIKLVDTVWDMNLRVGGKIFAQQANIGIDHITGDWAFHIQADEVMHEDALPIILRNIQQYDNDKEIDGFLFPFIHFWGDYRHIRNSRRVHRNEIRLFRNRHDGYIRAYRDSQGFRIYSTLNGYKNGLEKGQKLKVVKIPQAVVFHYNNVKTPNEYFIKVHKMGYFYDEKVPNLNLDELTQQLDLNKVDRVEVFDESHPSVMSSRIASYLYHFTHDISKAQWKTKDRLLQPIEDVIGYRFGEYRNYILLKR